MLTKYRPFFPVSLAVKSGLLALLLMAAPALAQAPAKVEFERMAGAQYRQTINKAHKAYRSGRLEEALALYNLTARWGEPDCQRQLGIMLLSGEGTDVDLVEGMAWIELAAMTRRKADLDVRRQAREQLPEDAVAAGEALAEEYAPRFGAKATGMVCKRKRLKESGRKEVQCERRVGSMSEGDVVEVPVVESQYYWAIQ